MFMCLQGPVVPGSHYIFPVLEKRHKRKLLKCFYVVEFLLKLLATKLWI